MKKIKEFKCKLKDDDFSNEVCKKSKLWDFDFEISTCSDFIENFVVVHKNVRSYSECKSILYVKYNDNFKLPIDMDDFACIQILDDDTIEQFIINGGDGFLTDFLLCLKLYLYL